MDMRVASDRCVIAIRLSIRPVLEKHGGARGVVPKSDPANRTGVRAVFTAGPFSRPPHRLGDVAHRPVSGPVDGVPDQRQFRRGRRELGCETDGLVRAEHQVEARQLALVLRPGLPRIGTAALEQPRHLDVPRHLAWVDADRLGDDCRHVRPPGRPAVAARVIGG